MLSNRVIGKNSRLFEIISKNLRISHVYSRLLSFIITQNTEKGNRQFFGNQSITKKRGESFSPLKPAIPIHLDPLRNHLPRLTAHWMFPQSWKAQRKTTTDLHWKPAPQTTVPHWMEYPMG